MILTQYRQRSGKIKALATRYWLAVILEYLQLGNLNQLSEFIKQKQDAPEHAKCSTSFLYKKWQGSPIDSEAKIKLMNELVPGVSQCLTNPLWQLLDSGENDAQVIYSVLTSLNAHITASLFEPLTNMALPQRRKPLTKDQIRNIGRFNAPDALTCLLALSKEDNEHRRSLERHAYQLFMRLTIFTPLSVIRDELYDLIFRKFFTKPAAQRRDYRTPIDNQYLCFDSADIKCIRIGTAFIPVTSSYLDEIAKYYQRTAKDMVSLNLIRNTSYDKMLFTYAFDNTDKGWILTAILSLQQNKDPGVSTPYLSMLLEQMKYISRKQQFYTHSTSRLGSLKQQN